MRNKDTLEAAQGLSNYAFNLIGKRRYTVKQVEKKLLSKAKKNQILASENFEEIVDEIIQRLIELKFLDDQKFIEDYVDERSRLKPRGKYMLTQELRQKGVDGRMISAFFHEASFDEEPLAKALIERKMEKWLNVPTRKQKEKAFNYLKSKGFVIDVVYKVINSCYNLD